MKTFKMKPNTQFKINSVEELKEIYNACENEKNFSLHKEIKDFDEKNHNYWCCVDGECFIYKMDDYYEIIPNPLKTEYPKEMWVWNDCEDHGRNKKVIGFFDGRYIAQDKFDKNSYHAYNHAKDIEEEDLEIKDSDIATVEALHDTLLDAHGYKLNSNILSRARELTKKMYKIIDNAKKD